MKHQYLKCIQHFFHNPLLGSMLCQEYFLKIWVRSDQPLQSTGLKCVSLSAHALVSVTGGLFDVYDVTSNTYNVFPPLVVHLGYQWREIFDLRGCNSVMGGPIDIKLSGAFLGRTGFLARCLLEKCMIHFKKNFLQKTCWIIVVTIFEN